MTGQTGLVSIGMPVFNGARFLNEAVAALLAQDYSPLELIISDNASTDATESLCRAWVAKDSRVKYLRQPARLDVATNFNATLAAARGEFFMWAADDDLWEPAFIRTLVQLLQPEPAVALAFCDFNNFDVNPAEGGEYPRLRELPVRDRCARLQGFLRQKIKQGKPNLIYGLMRRETIAAIGGFKVWGSDIWGADMLVVLRLLAEGNLALSPERLFHKRVSPPRPDGAVPAGSRGSFSEARGKLREKLGFVTGCSNVLRDVRDLTAGERLRLRHEVLRLRFYFCLRECGQAVAGVFKPRRLETVPAGAS